MAGTAFEARIRPHRFRGLRGGRGACEIFDEDRIKSLTVDSRPVVIFQGIFLRGLFHGLVNKLRKDCIGSRETMPGAGRSQPDSSVNNLEVSWPDSPIAGLQGIRKAF